MEERIKRIIGKIIDLKEFAYREINDKYFAGQAVGLNFVLGLIYDEFPELAESEDERMRQVIVEYHKQQFEKNYDQEIGLFHKDALAYLEKQKEQKVDIDKLRRDLYQSGYNDGYQHGKEDAQKEQKPAEWSEKDEEKLELVIDCIYEFYPDVVMKYELKDWLKSLRPSWKPSEEQMGCLERVIAFKHPEPEDIKGCEELLEQLKRQM